MQQANPKTLPQHHSYTLVADFDHFRHLTAQLQESINFQKYCSNNMFSSEEDDWNLISQFKYHQEVIVYT